MSGQQHAPVPETTPLPPASQPDGYPYQPGPGAGSDAGSVAGPARPAEPVTEPVTSLGTFSSGGAASDAAPHAAVPDSAAPAGDLNSQTTNYQAPYAGWGAGGVEPSASGGAGTGWGGPPSAGKAGGPAAGGKPWTMRRGLVVAGAATVLAAGAGATVYGLGSNAAAAGGTAAGAQGGLAQGGTQGGLSQGGMQGGLPQDGGSMGGPGMQAPGSGTVPGQGGDFAPNGLGGMGSGVSAAVHSEYVVEENGEYVTKVAQLGTVSAVSSGSVTVKSVDGFTRTYTLSDDTVVSNMLQRRQQSATGDLTVADIVSGAAVRIVAGKDASAFPAESVQVSGGTQSGGSPGSGGETQPGGTGGTGQSS